MIDRIAAFVSRHPWPFIIFFLLVSVGVGSRLPSAKVDPEVKSQLPSDWKARVDMDLIEKKFGGSDMMMITLVAPDVLDTAVLRRIKQLSDKIGKLDQVDKVLSLFEMKNIKDVGGTMHVDPAVKDIPTDAKGRKTLRRELKDNDLIYGSLVSKDFRATAVIGLLKMDAKDFETLQLVRKLIKETPGPGEIHIAGMPYVRVLMSTNIQGDIRRFLPAGLLIMLVLLFISFRQLRGTLLPFVVVVMSILFSMGLIPLLGWKIQMITVILPVVMIAIANDYGIHIIASYQEQNTPGNDLTRRDLARGVLSQMAKPIGIAGLTTIAGLSCLGLHLIVPAKQLGLLASSGILFALLASLLFIPAVLAVLPKAKPIVTAATASEDARLMERMLAAVSRFVSKHPKPITVTFIVATIVVGLGITLVQIDTNVVNYFPSSHPVVRASNIADKYFGGSTSFSLVLTGDIKHPTALNLLDRLETGLRKQPHVTQTSSIARVVRRMNRVMNNNDPKFDRIPDTRDAVAQLLLMYENSGDPKDFDRLVDFRYREALLTVRVATPSTKEQAKVIGFVRRFLAKNRSVKLEFKAVSAKPGKAKDSPFTMLGAGKAKPGKAKDSPFTMLGAGTAKPGTAKDSPFTMLGAGKAKPGKAKDSPFTMLGTPGKPTGTKAGAKTAAAGRKGAAVAKAPKDPAALPKVARFTMFGGFLVLFSDLVDAVVMGQGWSLAVSLLLVVLIVSALFRSPVAGLISGGSLVFAMAILFGLMGFIGLDLNLPTAMLSSIVIGVGVDYTIHFLWRYRLERRAAFSREESVFRTLTTVGRGIIVNALSVVIGFAIMMLSAFLPVRTFGYLVVVSISACLLGALVFIPSLVILFEPKALGPEGGK